MKHFKSDILFILKQRNLHYSNSSLSSGLANSIRMLVKMLRSNSVDAVAVEVIDNNHIDRLVHQYRPRTVIIEALWVVPEKLALLKRLHPDVRWIVRLHSKLPFIASEGMAMRWIADIAALRPYVELAANSTTMCHDLRVSQHTQILYLPNHYEVELKHGLPKVQSTDRTLNVSCFGAIRPLKNQLLQAVAALRYADENYLSLRFHINSTRVEGSGESILKNIRALFSSSSRHQLIEHKWLDHHAFKRLIRDEINLGLQVSYSETYNIVAADHIDCGVPVVVSDEITFVDPAFVADPNSVLSIVCAMEKALSSCVGKRRNTRLLQQSNEDAREAWERAFDWDTVETTA